MPCAICGESRYQMHQCDTCGAFVCDGCGSVGYACKVCQKGKLK